MEVLDPLGLLGSSDFGLGMRGDGEKGEGGGSTSPTKVLVDLALRAIANASKVVANSISKRSCSLSDIHLAAGSALNYIDRVHRGTVESGGDGKTEMGLRAFER